MIIRYCATLHRIVRKYILQHQILLWGSLLVLTTLVIKMDYVCVYKSPTIVKENTVHRFAVAVHKEYTLSCMSRPFITKGIDYLQYKHPCSAWGIAIQVTSVLTNVIIDWSVLLLTGPLESSKLDFKCSLE